MYMKSHGKKRNGITILAFILRENRNAKSINVYKDWEQKSPEGYLMHTMEEKAKNRRERIITSFYPFYEKLM